MKLGVAIITLNEEKNIERTLSSIASIADEIVVIDSYSTDGTEEIAKKFNVTFIKREWPGFADQKQFAIEQIKSEWILALDADEVLTPECANEIKKIVETPKPNFKSYRIPRKLYFMGRTLHYGKGVDKPVRLFQKGVGVYDQRLIHEQVIVNTPLGTLKSPMIHYSAESISRRIKKIRRDNILELKHYNQGQGHLSKIILNPFKNLYFNIIKRSAYRDGLPGIILALLFCYQLFDHELQFYRNRRMTK